ncbi:hypothetical protein EXS71_02675 [Candidatus Uhrbacteria bacterium]|nr:hypothetical protein [Candidatus Uhrbacteria bacterium]
MPNQTEIKQNLYNSLKELGLKSPEIELYILSLSHGPTSLATLAKLLEISRPNIYKIITELKKHGLAQFSGKNRYSKTFVVESPSIVTELIRNKRESLNKLDKEMTSALPDLLMLYRQGELPSSVKIIEGKELFEQTFDKILEETKQQTEFFGSAQDFIQFVSWEKEQAWIRRRVEKNIFMRALLLPGSATQQLQPNDKRELRETRILKSVAPFASSFHLFADRVILWQPKAPLAILIADQYIVEMLRNIFNNLWEQSKK